jgi:hypothetical protein
VSLFLADDRAEVLAAVDLEALFLEEGQMQRHRQWTCPSPAHAQTGATPPVSLDAARGLWNCHGCPAGGSAVDLLILSRGLTTHEAFEMLRTRTATIAARPRPAPRPAVDTSRPLDDDGATLARFLEARGWRHDTAVDRFGLSAVATSTGPRIRFPFRSGGELLTWQDRATTGHGRKWLSAKGRPLRLYAADLEHELDKGEEARERYDTTQAGVAILLEGPPDVIALAHAFTGGALALPGANNLRACRVGTMLADFDVIVAMDNDEAGQDARRALTTELHAHGCRVAHLHYPQHVNDLDDWRRSLDCDDDALAAELLEHLDALEWESPA